MLVVSTLQFVGPPDTPAVAESPHLLLDWSKTPFALMAHVSSDSEFREWVEFACCEEDCCPLARVNITQVGACRSTDLNHARPRRIVCQ